MDAALFLEQFVHMADSPGGVGKLRNLILELAVRGRLVPQDPDDEPADALLKRIEAEKKRLIKAGEIKSPKPLPPIHEDEVPYALPDGWVWVRFGLITFNRDAERIPLSKDDRQLRQGEYPYYGASGIIDYIDDYIFDKSLLLIGEDGANLLARSTPIAFIAHGRYWVNNHAHVIDGYNYDFLRYLEVFINAISLELYVTGTAQPKMNQAKMNSIPVALPPLAEQQRIVAKVDELMALCDQLEAEQDERDHLRDRAAKSTLHHLTDAPTRAEARRYWGYAEQHFPHLFDRSATVADLRATILQLAVQGRLVPQNPDDEPASELLKRIEAEKARLVRVGAIKPSKPLPPIREDEVPYPVPDGWAWVLYAKLAAISSGATKGRKLQNRKIIEVPYLRVANVQRWFVDLSHVKHIQIAEDELDKFSLRQNDILQVEGGDWDKVGRAALWEHELEVCIHQNHIFKARLYSDYILPRYMLIYLNSEPVKQYYQSCSKQTTNLASINQTQLKATPIALPPVVEQQRIVAKVDELMALCDQLEAAADARQALAGRLFDSIVYHLFEPSVVA